MTQIIIEHPKTREGETIEVPAVLGFSEVLKYLRNHPEYRSWKYIESRVLATS